MERFGQWFYNTCVDIANSSQWIVLGIVVLVVLIIGISLMVSKPARDNAKQWIPWVFVGAFAATLAVTIADTIAGLTNNF